VSGGWIEYCDEHPDDPAVRALKDSLEAMATSAADFVALFDNGERAELAALKARRCDGCQWYEPEPEYEDDRSTGECMVGLHGQTPAVWTCGSTLVAADHACNAWTAKCATDAG
jgi:hypothetical protein